MSGAEGSNPPATLGTRIEGATARGGAVTFVCDPGAPRVEWSRLHDDARATAAALQRLGIGPGAHVALAGPSSRLLVTALQGVWLAGATAVVLPLPRRLLDVADMVAATRSRLRASSAVLVVADPILAAFIEPVPGDPPVVLLPDLEREAAAAVDRFDAPVPDPAALAAVQFTSGVTADPRGATLTHAAVVSNLDAVAGAAGLDPDADVIVSWLPLYHDMGLFGLLGLSMVTGTDLVLATPLDFLADPGRWTGWMSHFGGTATAGPNFSYALLTRALSRDGTALDLSRWRIALNGAEPVGVRTMLEFTEAGAAHGLDPGAVLPAFGMAEVVTGATLSRPGRGLVCDQVDGHALEAGAAARPGATGHRLPLLGGPVAGLDLRICDPLHGHELGERQVGELEVRGASVTAGYHGRPDATAAAFHDGWLRTGDLAYLTGGELVVWTRLADAITVGGRRLAPDGIEQAAATVDGVRAGNVAAFGVGEGRSRTVVVAAEVRDGARPGVGREVAGRVAAFTGLPAPDVVLLPPGSLSKTSSGKLQRWRCRAAYLTGRLEVG